MVTILPKIPKVFPSLVPLVLDYHAQDDLYLDPLGQTTVIKSPSLLISFLQVTMSGTTQAGVVYILEPALLKLVTLLSIDI